MATFQVSGKKKNNHSSKNAKKVWGIVLLAISTFIFLFSVTSLIPALQYFFRGVFGLFVYPMAIFMMIIGLALLNDKKYVMSKKYAILLTLTLFFLLTIIQLAILGEPKNSTGEGLSFGQYLALSYTKQFTVGGILIGLVVSCFVMLMGTWASGIIFSLAFICSCAFFIETVMNMRREQNMGKPLKLEIKEKKVKEKKSEKKSHKEINVVLAGSIQEELSKERTAKEKLGLIGNTTIQSKKEEEVKIPQGMSIREYLLSPPKVNIDEFMAKKSYPKNQFPSLNNEEIQKNIYEVKSTETILPSKDSQDEFELSQMPIRRNLDQALPEIESEAENIIRSVVEQELIEREDIQVHEEQTNYERGRRGERRFVNFEEPSEVEYVKPYNYKAPMLELITTASDDLAIFNEEIPAKRVALENALEKFGVPAKVQSVVIGPTVTRYEIAMPEGISVKKILSLDADIAYALSAKGQIRIEAPIPGRSIVGIEVPNSRVAKVSIKDVLQSKEFVMSPSPLAFALGKDITGSVRVCNLQKMPHLLVAGTTGSGKSVCLNAIITSILYKASPDEVKFIMIDPKQVELSMYEGLPHMIVPKVITDPTKAVNALQWAVDEMERRFNLISEARVRNIDEYNKIQDVLLGHKKRMPYIIVIFDEFADFMMVAKNEIEDKIRRLAGKARAAGIHLILATQRPSTDVVTGTIKANFPARIAFKVASRVDSEVIMGSIGAEKLLGYGDMLYKPTDSAPVRLQGCFIDTPETKEIVNYIIQNNDEIYDEEVNNFINGMNKAPQSERGDSSMDPLLPQALKICIDNGVASTTMVQRKLAIGYPRAARIIDQMEERGYISTAEGSKQRTVYTSIEEFYQIFGDDYD